MLVIIVSLFIGILVSRTTFFEFLKKKLLDKGFDTIVKGLDCPFCCCFWSSLILSLIYDCDIEHIIFNVCLTPVIGFYISKGT